jgi:hypothetical protein
MLGVHTVAVDTVVQDDGVKRTVFIHSRSWDDDDANVAANSTHVRELSRVTCEEEDALVV